MNRRLWHTTPKIIERKRYFVVAPIVAATIGAGALGALGGGLFGKKKKQEGQFNYYETPDYRNLYNLLYQGSQQGYPEIMSESYWGEPWRQTGQDIRELFEAKKGLGAGTPEYTQLQNARAGLTSNLIGQNINAKQNFARLLAGITPQPQTTYTPEGPSGLENLLSFGAPVASTALSGYLQNQSPMNKAFTEYIQSQIKPKSVASVYDNNYPEILDEDFLKILLASGGK